MSAITPLDLARAAGLAYGPPFDLAAGGCEIKNFDRPETAGHQAANVIAIQGTTADGRDVMTDAAAWPKRDPDLGYCHAGFLAGARAVWPALEKHIRDQLSADRLI